MQGTCTSPGPVLETYQVEIQTRKRRIDTRARFSSVDVTGLFQDLTLPVQVSPALSNFTCPVVSNGTYAATLQLSTDAVPSEDTLFIFA